MTDDRSVPGKPVPHEPAKILDAMADSIADMLCKLTPEDALFVLALARLRADAERERRSRQSFPSLAELRGFFVPHEPGTGGASE